MHCEMTLTGFWMLVNLVIMPGSLLPEVSLMASCKKLILWAGGGTWSAGAASAAVHVSCLVWLGSALLHGSCLPFS